MLFYPRSTPETIVVDVDSGAETGVYYITICNLRFGTTWQSFKDWARSACEIDHVAIFPSSTSGWVRVLGRDNFERAWARLNGGNFNGRAVIASDQNASEPIKIKELADEPSTRRRKRAVSASNTSPTSAAMAHHRSPAESYSAESYSAAQPSPDNGYSPQEHGSSSSSVGTYQHPNSASRRQRHSGSSNSSSSRHYGGTNGHGQTSPQYYGGSSRSSAQGYSAEAPAFQPAGGSQHAAYDEQGESSSRVHYENNDNREYVGTEPRKILVTNIHRKDRPGAVTGWLRRRMGPQAAQVVDLELPLNEAAGRLRGHAYIVFETTHAASQAIEKLHGLTYKKRELCARFTTEGVPSAQEEHPGAASIVSNESTSPCASQE